MMETTQELNKENEMFWYELLQRGYSIGTQPKGQIDWEINRVNSKGRNYGAVAYESPLSEEDVFYYDLMEIDPIR